LVAAGVTYGTATIPSTWAWRVPSLLQGFWSLVCISVLAFLPESPRWLIFHGRDEEALRVLAQINADSDENNSLVHAFHQEIIDSIALEKLHKNSSMTVKEIVRSRSALKRLSLVFSCALATVIVGKFLN
jgi:Sugar (and other) transporter